MWQVAAEEMYKRTAQQGPKSEGKDAHSAKEKGGKEKEDIVDAEVLEDDGKK